jgi:hypothetical protein
MPKTCSEREPIARCVDKSIIRGGWLRPLTSGDNCAAAFALLRNHGSKAPVLKLMRSIWRISNLGLPLMIISPILALGFGWEAFFPVALTSLLGGTIFVMGKGTSPDMFVGHLTAELVQDLVSADNNRRNLVFAELNEAERNWFLAELPRAEAELRRQHGQKRTDWRMSVRWAWRLRLLKAVAYSS